MHLIFADDLIVFSPTDPKTVQHIMEAFGNSQIAQGWEQTKLNLKWWGRGDTEKTKSKGSKISHDTKKEQCLSGT